MSDNNAPSVVAQEKPATQGNPTPGHDPTVLQPRINDILRTRHCILGSIFLIEGIKPVPLPDCERKQVIQVLLGDGELCIQALPRASYHQRLENGDISVGCYVRLDDFFLRSSIRRERQGPREIVHLVILDMAVVGQNETYRKTVVNQGWAPPNTSRGKRRPGPSRLRVATAAYEDEETEDQQPADTKDKDGDAFEAFDARALPLRQARRARAGAPDLSKPLAVALPRNWHNHQDPLKLTTLRSIPKLPFAQNWTCNVLAVVVSLSPVTPSPVPPYSQRTARLADPSTIKQVHLTVFLNPDGFAPEIGSVVLLVGVKNHRFDGGSLKKYASDSARTGGDEWWFQNPEHMGWCDVATVKKWWEQQQADPGAVSQGLVTSEAS